MYKNFNKTINYIFLILIFSSNAMAMSIDQYIDNLIENHPHFDKINLIQQSKLLDKEAKSSKNSWSVANFLSGNSLDDLNFNASIDKNMQNGSNLSLSHNWIGSRNSNTLALEYKIPFIQNANGINDSLDSDIATIEIEIQNLTNLDSNESFIAEKIKNLMNLEFTKQNLKIQEKQLSLIEQNLEIIQNKYDKGLVYLSDVLSVSESKLNQEKQYAQIKYELELLTLEAVEQINANPDKINIEIDLHEKQLIEYDNIEDILPELRVIKKIDLEKSKLNRQLKTLENRLLPYAIIKAGNILTNSPPDKYLDSFSNLDSNWYVGVDAGYELGGGESEINLENFKNSIALLDVNKKELEMNISQQIQNLQKKIDHLHKIKLFSFYQKNIIEKKLTEEKNKYEKLLSKKEFVIAAEQYLNSVNLIYIQNSLNYQKAVIDYLSLIDKFI